MEMKMEQKFPAVKQQLLGQNEQLEISIIIPIYNEAPIIRSIIQRVKEVMDSSGYSYEIVVVNDGSTDDIKQALAKQPIRLLSHPYNIGNGAAVKTGIRNAGGEYLLMIDGDGQHDPQDIPRLLNLLPQYDMVVGARSKDSQASIGRTIANRSFNYLASYLARHKIDDLTSGLRAIKRSVAAAFLYLLPNGFSYLSTITLALFRAGYTVTYIPIVAARRTGKSKIRLLRDGYNFLMIITRVGMMFAPLRIFMPISLLLALMGFGYSSYTLIFEHRFTNMGATLILVAVIVFLLGLVAEQIAQLRLKDS